MYTQRDKEFREKLLAEWKGTPPRIMCIAKSMPSSPNLKLQGGGFTCDYTTTIEVFVKRLEKVLQNKSGDHYITSVAGTKGEDEADIFVLEGWEVLTGGVNEYVVILYYSALNPYLTIKKHMGEDMAKRHLAKKSAQKAIADALT